MTTQLPTQQGGEVDDGGPAFPREDYQTASSNGQCGMSLRDYIAAKAIQGELASQTVDKEYLSTPTMMKTIAEFAYSVADAMIAARNAS